MSEAKRLRYDFDSSEESDDIISNEEYQVKGAHQKHSKCASSSSKSDLDDSFSVEIRPYQSRRKPKCSSKNAQMARENRLRKKIYVAKLEKQVADLKKDNSKLSQVIDDQTLKVSDLNNEVKYLRAVLANSSDISKLLRNIHQQTDMPVSTSLNKSLFLPNNMSSPAARKTMHSWDEKEEFSASGLINPDLELGLPENHEDDLFPYLLDGLGTHDSESNDMLPQLSFHEEHNYTRDQALMKNLGEMEIFLLKLYHQMKSLTHLVDENEVARKSKVIKNVSFLFS